MCAYKGECYRWCVVYKATCKSCGDFYVNTQNTLKNNGTTITRCDPKGHSQ